MSHKKEQSKSAKTQLIQCEEDRTMAKWYGNLNNRLAENGKDAEVITVGMGVTEFYWSDRDAYEVVEVTDQKHIGIRRLDPEHIGLPYQNKWELHSNPEHPVIHLVKRGNNWYTTVTMTAEELADYDSWELDKKLWFMHSGLDMETIRAKGKQTKYHKRNIRVGYADYYYDYEF